VFAFAVRRVLLAIPILIVSTFAIFLVCASFMNPANQLFGRGKPPSAREIALFRHTYWLDQPLMTRYWHWLTGLFHGRWGPSVQHYRIGHEIWTRLGVTFRLVVMAMIIAAILAVIVGVVSAVKQYSLTDYTFSFAGFLFLSLPSFWFAILLKQFGIEINRWSGHQVLYTIGDRSFSGSNAGSIGDIIGHMVLPTITLALISFASWSRYNRGSMLEVLNSDYIRLARAKGLRRRRVMIRHALRTALVPMVTVMALDAAAILGGAIVTETVFQWHGMGDFLLTSIQYQDQFAVLAWLLVFGFIVILFNLLADLLYAVLDPRIRYD
jgi:peptide/nickel transport system permease protein